MLDDDENTFNLEGTQRLIKDTCEAVIGSLSYQQDKLNKWSSDISEQIVTALCKLNKPFKYIVTCGVMQKCGAGVHTSSAYYWDNTTDAGCTIRWENSTCCCVVSVYGIAI